MTGAQGSDTWATWRVSRGVRHVGCVTWGASRGVRHVGCVTRCGVASTLNALRTDTECVARGQVQTGGVTRCVSARISERCVAVTSL